MSAADWKWCGGPHHFMGSRYCSFGMATWVADGKFCVSTVGEYRPGGANSGDAHTVGRGLYETMVFFTRDTDTEDCGNPALTRYGNPLATAHADTPTEANETHRRLCDQFDTARVCDKCDGNAVVEVGTHQDEFGNWDTEEVPCPQCDGEGHIFGGAEHAINKIRDGL